jgi:hypothetical protein
MERALQSEKGVFRGSNFNDTKTSIKKREKLTLTAENDSILCYELLLHEGDSSNILYYFYYFNREMKLNSFAISFSLENDDLDLSLKKNLFAYFNRKFGSPFVPDPSHALWKTGLGFQVEMVFLNDESGTGTELIYSPQ